MRIRKLITFLMVITMFVTVLPVNQIKIIGNTGIVNADAGNSEENILNEPAEDSISTDSVADRDATWTKYSTSSDFYAYIINVNTGKYADYKYDDSEGYMVFKLAEYNNRYDYHQMFRFVRQSDNTYAIFNAYSLGSLSSSKMAQCFAGNGSKIRFYTGYTFDSAYDNEKWILYKNAEGHFAIQGYYNQLWISLSGSDMIFSNSLTSSGHWEIVSATYEKPSGPENGTSAIRVDSSQVTRNQTITISWEIVPARNSYDIRCYYINIRSSGKDIVDLKNVGNVTSFTCKLPSDLSAEIVIQVYACNLNTTYMGPMTWIAVPYYTPTNTPKPTATNTPSPTATNTPIPVGPTEVPCNPELAGFVERLYTVALGRDSEQTGKNYWITALQNGATGAEAAHGFFFAPEIVDANLSKTDYITRLYRTFMDREPDSAGLDFWLGELVSGKTREEVFYGFINSAEWITICENSGINPGSTSSSQSQREAVVAFATRLYTTCLGRDGEQAGINYWTDLLVSGSVTGSDAARQFFFSEEFLNGNHDNVDYINRLYRTFMGRDASLDEIDYWVTALYSGGSRENIFNDFAGSPEFANLCRSAGINP